MSKVDSQLERYRSWLEAELNSYADACSSYAHANDESPSDDLRNPYSALSEAWDALCILVDGDTRYTRRTAWTFGETHPDWTALKKYHQYIREVLKANHAEKEWQMVFNQWRKVKAPVNRLRCLQCGKVISEESVWAGPARCVECREKNMLVAKN